MKSLLLINIALLLFTSGAQAATIKVGSINDIQVADVLTASSNNLACESSSTAANCDFEQTFHAGTYLSNTALSSLVTSDYRTSVKSPVESNAFLDLSFSNTMYGGEGNDLVLFFIGNTTSFGLDVFDMQNNDLMSTGTYTIETTDAVFNDDGSWLCISANATDSQCSAGYPLSAIFIDFGAAYDGVEIGNIHLTLGDGFNDVGSSNFSLAGGFHGQAAAVVPLPLPIVLFSSGLAMLGWFGRRKAA